MKYSLNEDIQTFKNPGYTSSYLSSEVGPNLARRRTRYIVLAVIIGAAVLALVIGLSVGLTRKSSAKGQGSVSKQKDKEGKITTKGTQPTTKTSQGTQPTTNTGQTTVRTTPSVPDREWVKEPCIDTEAEQQCPWSSNPLLVVSLDGFRADYLLRNFTPTIQKLATCGVHTPYMRSVYPTLTFPNHYSIVTGLYPESHGIVGNHMYDPALNQTFSLRGDIKYMPEWWFGEPMWTTASKHGKKSAAYFWVGSDVNISGHHPDIWKKYDGSVSFEQRVDTFLEWMRLPDGDRPEFMLLYFNQPDHQGHGTGQKVNEMLGVVDAIIGRLMNGLLKQKMDHCVNIMIMADHGMEDTTCDRRVLIDKYIHVKDFLIFDGTTGHINSKFYKSGKVVLQHEHAVPAETVSRDLECKSSHLNVFTAQTIPKRHHYSSTPRIGNVVMDVETKWLVADNKGDSCLKGNHGYDNIYKSMHALFLAHGPQFQQNYKTEPFENIELYNLMADLLNIPPAPNNGTYGSLHHLLRNPPKIRYQDITHYQHCYNGTTDSNDTDINACSCNTTQFEFSAPDEGTYLASLYKIALPVPVPVASMNVCTFAEQQYTTAYSSDYKMPVWTTFFLTHEMVSKKNKSKIETCSVRDSRLTVEQNPSCSHYRTPNGSIRAHRLFNPEYTDSLTEQVESLLSSNLVPMYEEFEKGIWSYLISTVEDFAHRYGNITITTGPIFDYNHDGLQEGFLPSTRYVDSTLGVALPSHFYMIVSKCANSSTGMCEPDQRDFLSFILPHQKHIHNCLPERDFLKNNLACIRDIELLTGFRYFTTFDHAKAAEMRTFLPLELWESKLTESWEDMPCDDHSQHQCPPGPVPLLLISLDGFRADYMKRNLTPTMKKLSQCGVHTPYMRAVYPTLTFPNHYTIVTGLYPESHGIISNQMYDEKIDTIFKISLPTKSDPQWWKGEPIWITAQKQNKSTATFFWPGSDVNISGTYPNEWKRYDGKVGYPERLSVVLDWLTRPADQRPDFITLYFDEPDHAGHQKGPESEMVDGQIETVEEIINRLMNKLHEKGLQNCVNIIILADHGFSDQSCEKTVVLRDYYQNITRMLVFERTAGQIFTEFYKKKNTVHRLDKPFSVEEVMKGLNCKNSAMKVFTKKTFPRRHHYTNNARIGDIILDMQDEYLVFDDRKYYCDGGNHGWDNIYKHMHALFLAHGPGFKQNFTAQPFENIELYNLMAELLKIKPSPNNGTRGSLHYLLRNPSPLPSHNALDNYTQCETVDGSVILDTECGCDTAGDTSQNIELGDVIGDPTGKNLTGLLLGLPALVVKDDVCILQQEKSLTAYSQTRHSPMWTFRKLSNNSVNFTNQTSYCVVNDPRVNSTTNCTSYSNMTAEPLLRLASKMVLSSHIVPMHAGFKSGIWKFTWELVEDFVQIYGDLNIIAGPIYDYNLDGLWETNINETRYADEEKTVPIPTHIFIILMKCRDQSQSLPCGGNVDLLSFIIPHLEEVPNCLKGTKYLKDNVARVRDIELMTGLTFFTDLDMVIAARLRTFLPEKLWYSHLTLGWMDLPCPSHDMCTSDYKPVMLVSLDGFRADYLIRNFTPHVQRLSECGVHAPYMKSVYPTKTFPNHYTIATGLYPESHGIIDNNMYDAEIGAKFYLSSHNASDPRWWGGEPIWLTAKKQGKRTATYFWPGSDVLIQGMYPDIYKKYDGKVTYSGRVDEVLTWLDRPADKRPDFITLYFDEPDLAGHKVGPSNIEGIGAALDKVDESIGRLLDGLYDRRLHNCVNLIIIADHGMDDVSCKKLVRLNDGLDLDWMRSHVYVWEGPFGRISNKYTYKSKDHVNPVAEPVPNSDIEQNITCLSGHMRVYEKSSLPVRHHYSNNPRIDDIILDIDSGWLVTRSWARYCRGGNHGYDNIYKSMEALFLAYGPAFKWNYTVEPFENIELYNMFTEILNVTAAPNNGTLGSLNHVLKMPPPYVESRSDANYTSLVMTQQDIDRFEDLLGGETCCSAKSNVLLKQFIQQLMLITEGGAGVAKHIPWGAPYLQGRFQTDSGTLRFQANGGQGTPVKLLYQSTYITAYDYDLPVNLPVWLSQTAEFSQISASPSLECTVPDPRVVPDVSVSTKYCSPPENPGMVWNSLLTISKPDENSLSMELLSSTLVPMWKDFAEGTWLNTVLYLKALLKIYKHLNVVTGPVFDFNHDGLADSYGKILQSSNNSVLVPTHYFVVLMRCNQTDVELDKCNKYSTVSYILPHVANSTNCLNTAKYLTENMARVRDVELITGLQFLTGMSSEQSIALRTFLPMEGQFHI